MLALFLVSLGLAAPQPAREGRVISSGSGKDFHMILGLSLVKQDATEFKLNSLSVQMWRPGGRSV